MNRQRYNSDLIDAEWELLGRTMAEVRTSNRGRKPVIVRREIINAKGAEKAINNLSVGN